MKSVYRYVLDYCWNVVEDPKIPYTIELPKGATVLSCGLQNKENVCIWAMVDPNQTEMIEAEFYIFGTGWSISDDISNGLRFIGTYIISDGMFAYHVFMKEPVLSHSVVNTPYSPSLSACEEKQLEYDVQETI